MKQLQPTKTTAPEEKVALAYVVNCSSVGNEDHGENPNLPMSVPGFIPCETLRQCSQVCQRYIEEWDLGSGNWTGGEILHPTKGLIAIVSYNGRIWKYSGKKITLQDLQGRQISVAHCNEEITEGLDDKL